MPTWDHQYERTSRARVPLEDVDEDLVSLCPAILPRPRHRLLHRRRGRRLRLERLQTILFVGTRKPAKCFALLFLVNDAVTELYRNF